MVRAIGSAMELSREEVQRRLGEVGYVADPQLAMAITLMRTLGRPLLLEARRASARPRSARRSPACWASR